MPVFEYNVEGPFRSMRITLGTVSLNHRKKPSGYALLLIPVTSRKIYTYIYIDL